MPRRNTTMSRPVTVSEWPLPVVSTYSVEKLFCCGLSVCLWRKEINEMSIEETMKAAKLPEARRLTSLSPKAKKENIVKAGFLQIAKAKNCLKAGRSAEKKKISYIGGVMRLSKKRGESTPVGGSASVTYFLWRKWRNGESLWRAWRLKTASLCRRRQYLKRSREKPLKTWWKLWSASLTEREADILYSHGEEKRLKRDSQWLWLQAEMMLEALLQREILKREVSPLQWPSVLSESILSYLCADEEMKRNLIQFWRACLCQREASLLRGHCGSWRNYFSVVSLQRSYCNLWSGLIVEWLSNIIG